MILIAVAGLSYNRLVKLSQAVDSQWAQVQNVYQRRADLIPNLVATVSVAANFEKSTLTEVTAARASVGQVKLDPNSARRKFVYAVDLSLKQILRRRNVGDEQCHSGTN